MSQERQPYANIQRVKNRCNQIDTHEVLKQEIYKQGYDYDTGFQFGFNGPSLLGGAPGSPGVVQTTLSGPSGAGVGFQDTELYFDSTQRDTSSDYTNGEIKWTVNTLNSSQSISNCIEMSLGTFFFPKIYSPTGTPEFFYYRRVFMEFENAPSTQAVLGPNNNRFHFEFEVENLTSQAVRLIPIKKSFFFQRPITTITDFDVRFTVPPTTSSPTIFKRIPIPNDTVQILCLTTGGFGYNPMRFRIVGSDTTTVLGPVGSTGTPGVAVFIKNFASNDAATNTQVNSTNGNYVTNILNNTDFEIGAINGTAVNTALQYGATMYIPKNRIAFPVRFTTVQNQLTNYTDVGHD